jgi:integrase
VKVGKTITPDAQHRTLVLLLAYTGIRWGEAVALRVKDIEFLDGDSRYRRTPYNSASLTPWDRPKVAKTAQSTLDTYSDLFDDDLDAVATILDHRYSPEVVAKMWPHGVQAQP